MNNNNIGTEATCVTWSTYHCQSSLEYQPQKYRDPAFKKVKIVELRQTSKKENNEGTHETNSTYSLHTSFVNSKGTTVSSITANDI